MKKAGYIVVSIVVAVMIVVNILLFMEGSLELYPTAEQVEKGRIAYGLLLIPLLATEALIVTRMCRK